MTIRGRLSFSLSCVFSPTLAEKTLLSLCLERVHSLQARKNILSAITTKLSFFYFEFIFLSLSRVLSLLLSLKLARCLYSIEVLFRTLLRRPRPEVAGSREYTPRAGLTSSSLSFCYQHQHQHQHHPRRRLRRRLRKVSSSFSSLLFSSSPSLSNRPCSLFARA